MLKYLFSIILATAIMNIGVQAGEYNHKDWPVHKNQDGIYTFTSSGKTKAISLCTAYYMADLKVMDEHGTATRYNQLIHSYTTKMRDSYRARYTGGDEALGELVKDMEWHFANSAQYGAFQEFKDSANMACESYAVENQIVSIDYIDGFNEQLLSAL
ncbi:MAG: hypothetical protein ACWA5L_04535 [bacterium]